MPCSPYGAQHTHTLLSFAQILSIIVQYVTTTLSDIAAHDAICTVAQTYLQDKIVTLPGEGLCNLLKNEGRADTAQALCQEVSTRAPGATWAWRRLGFFALDASDSEKAVLCFQTALRGDVRHVGAWEGLGSAYQSLARLTAALKVSPVTFAPWAVS